MQAFVHSDAQQAFILLGYAGTGKTTLLARLTDWLAEIDRPFRLLATTGRAAKVLQNKTARETGTVHGSIYAFDNVMGEEVKAGKQLQLNFQLRSNERVHPDTVFIVDEASMITHELSHAKHSATFGSGSLLNDFIAFLDGRKVVFVGDPCQLPPVADNPLSSALSTGFLRQNYEIEAQSAELQEVIRQGADSEILDLAGHFRRDILDRRFVKYPKVRAPSGRNASLHYDYNELLKAYVRRIRNQNYAEAVMIGHSNYQIAGLNRQIRNMLYDHWELQPRELLLVVQNSYNVALANGDQVILEEAGFDSKRAGFVFLRVKVRALYNDELYETLLIRDLLYNQRAGLTSEEVQRLMIDFDQRMKKKGLRRNTEVYLKAIRSDPYLNALRCKFGYALTCHKAQGGEWPEVYLNLYKSVYVLRDEALYRWFYTALTRAREHLHLNDGWWVHGFDRRRARKRPRFASGKKDGR